MHAAVKTDIHGLDLFQSLKKYKQTLKPLCIPPLIKKFLELQMFLVLPVKNVLLFSCLQSAYCGGIGGGNLVLLRCN